MPCGTVIILVWLPLCTLQVHPDAAHRIFVGGLPYYLEEHQIRELLGAFGLIKSFDMIRDKETRQFKGYARQGCSWGFRRRGGSWRCQSRAALRLGRGMVGEGVSKVQDRGGATVDSPSCVCNVGMGLSSTKTRRLRRWPLLGCMACAWATGSSPSAAPTKASACLSSRHRDTSRRWRRHVS